MMDAAQETAELMKWCSDDFTYACTGDKTVRDNKVSCECGASIIVNKGDPKPTEAEMQRVATSLAEPRHRAESGGGL